MNNEEKILSLLETLVTKVSSLESGQEKLVTKVSNLEAGQEKLGNELDFVKSTVVHIENEHGRKLDVLFDGYQQLDEKLDRIEAHVTSQDEVILKRVFPKAADI